MSDYLIHSIDMGVEGLPEEEESEFSDASGNWPQKRGPEPLSWTITSSGAAYTNCFYRTLRHNP